MLKQVRFQLCLDDPKLNKEDWVTVQGDRHQLEALHEAVSAYVQSLLETSLTRLQPSSQPEASSAKLAKVPSAPTLTLMPSLPNPAGIFLHPKGFLNHELNLGSLADSDSTQTVTLTTLQLFDLANALDNYAAEVTVLPDLARSQWIKATPTWIQVAAAALLTVGLTTSLAKVLDQPQPATLTTASTTKQNPTSTDQRAATQLPPSALQRTQPPVTSTQKLPPPPPLGSFLPDLPGSPPIKTSTPSPQPSPATTPAAGLPSPQAGEKPAANQPQQDVAALGRASESSSSPVDRIALSPAKAPAKVGASRPEPQAEAGSAPAPSSLAARNSAEAFRSPELTPPASSGSTVYQPAPQVAEARDYFKQRWQPPQGLEQTLEYSLAIAPNGSLESIQPLGEVASQYVGRTGVPALGEPIVSVLNSDRTLKVRLVLSPDGTVQTFQE
jgi:hypothetical protein